MNIIRYILFSLLVISPENWIKIFINKIYLIIVAYALPTDNENSIKEIHMVLVKFFLEPLIVVRLCFIVKRNIIIWKILTIVLEVVSLVGHY